MRDFARERKVGYSIRICLVSPLGMGTGSAKRAQQKVYLDETGGIGLGGIEGSMVSQSTCFLDRNGSQGTLARFGGWDKAINGGDRD